MGLNPGGDPTDLAETVASNAKWVMQDAPEGWSALLDQSWGYPRGSHRCSGRLCRCWTDLGWNPGVSRSAIWCSAWEDNAFCLLAKALGDPSVPDDVHWPTGG